TRGNRKTSAAGRVRTGGSRALPPGSPARIGARQMSIGGAGRYWSAWCFPSPSTKPSPAALAERRSTQKSKTTETRATPSTPPERRPDLQRRGRKQAADPAPRPLAYARGAVVNDAVFPWEE